MCKRLGGQCSLKQIGYTQFNRSLAQIVEVETLALDADDTQNILPLAI
jgi:DNA topoisomerase VI subunit B